jgi:hypothetical protein
VEARAVVQLSLPSSQIEAWANKLSRQNISWLASSGRLLLALQEPTLELLQSLRAEAERAGGSLTALRLPGAMRGELAPFSAPKGLHLMKKIKGVLDPKNIFNPGRLWR